MIENISTNVWRRILWRWLLQIRQ